MSSSVFDDPVWHGLFGDEDVAAAFAVARRLAHYLAFESALARAMAAEGLVTEVARDAILTACAIFEPDTAALSRGVARDGLPIPEFVRQVRAVIGPDHASAFHQGSTSQDVMDTALILTLKEINSVFGQRLDRLIGQCAGLTERFGENALMGRTRMQAALPIRVGDRIASWSAPIAGCRARLAALEPHLNQIQFGGPVGTRNGFDGKADAVAARMAAELGLHAPNRAWHSDRSAIVDYANWLSLVSGTVGKLGQDVALMAQQGIDDIGIAGGGASSAMPHKQNPIAAETLVALARYNAAQMGAMHQVLIHEQERSGIAWTLEFIALPMMCAATGRSLALASDLLASIDSIG